MARPADISAETAIANRLAIKWVHARDLAHEARQALRGRHGSEEYEPTQDDVIDEACKIFNLLSNQEQEVLRADARGDADKDCEPEWPGKAREHAERRERQLAEQQLINAEVANMTTDKSTAAPDTTEEATQTAPVTTHSIMSTPAAISAETAIANRLGIKWVHARELAKQAGLRVRNGNSTGGTGDQECESTKDDVIEEACKIFYGLSSQEQSRMRTSEAEPEWKRKAREHAERKERKWAEEQRGAAPGKVDGGVATKSVRFKNATTAPGVPEEVTESTTESAARPVTESTIPPEQSGCGKSCNCTIS